MNKIFSSKLELPKKHQQGNNVKAKFTLTNLTDDDYMVLSWYSPLEGLKSDCLKVTKDGQTIKYDGILFLRIPEPPTDAYVTIPAKGSVSTEFELTEGYHIAESGTYEVEVKSGLKHFFKISDLNKHKAQKVLNVYETPQFLIEDGKASFNVVEGDAPIETLGMKARRESEERAGAAVLDSSGPKSPTITGGTSDQQSILLTAWNNAYSLQLCAIRALGSTANDKLFKKYFGAAPTSENKNTAKSNYESMKTAMSSKTFTLTINGPNASYCSGGIIAYTYLNYTTIWFCQLFFTYCTPMIGIESEPAVTVHELSHAVCAIVDCNPGLQCSYSYGYFAGSVPYYTITSKNSEMLMDVDGASTQQGTPIIQWPGNGGYNQQWQFESAGGSYYKIKSVNSGMLADVNGASTQQGTSIIQWPDNGGANQQWQFESIGGAYYKIKNRNSGMLADVNGASTQQGTGIIQWPDNGGNNQIWKLDFAC